MSEDRSRILNMLADGKITAEEAERLLDALDGRDTGSRSAAENPGGGGSFIKGDPAPLLDALPKFLMVKVDGAEGERVDVKVPIALVRSGLKLTSLIPPQAMEELTGQMAEKGITIDFANLKPEDIDDLVEALREMTIDVDGKDGEKVRVYCA